MQTAYTNYNLYILIIVALSKNLFQYLKYYIR